MIVAIIIHTYVRFGTNLHIDIRNHYTKLRNMSSIVNYHNQSSSKDVQTLNKKEKKKHKKKKKKRNKKEEDELTAASIANKKHVPVEGDKNDSESDSQGGEIPQTFRELGLAPVLCEATAALKWSKPTEIQAESIPYALQGKDMIGLAETGSGKTGAFCLPILHALLVKPQRLYALILTPTRELAIQIGEQINALGGGIGVSSTVLVGGIDMMQQAIALAKKPHIVVATPGRLVDHLENTKGFNLRNLGQLVLDEADRMLSMDFEEEINKILDIIPTEGRRTSLFSATMTSKVNKLQRASLHDPVKVEVSDKYQTVTTLVQQYVFIPAKYKDCYLVYLMNEFAGQTAIIFASTHKHVKMTTLILRMLGFSVTCLHGGMTQTHRLGALNKFKAGSKTILIATDVASRGLDIPSVDLVINFDVPDRAKDYIHRVGRTARAGRSGRAITCVTQYDVEKYQRIESHLNEKLNAYPTDRETVMVLLERVCDAQRQAARQIREEEESKNSGHGRKRKGDYGNNKGGKRRHQKHGKRR